MDDINERLSQILSDPESMERVKAVAQSVLGGGEPQEESGGFDSETAAKIASLLSRFQGGGDDRAALLAALKPHLSDRRAKKADTAMKLLKVMDMLPYIKESGLLDLL